MPVQYIVNFKGCSDNNFQMKIFIFFLFLLITKIVGTRSNEYPLSMFYSKKKQQENVYTPVKHQFYFIKVGSKGV